MIPKNTHPWPDYTYNYPLNNIQSMIIFIRFNNEVLLRNSVVMLHLTEGFTYLFWASI